MNFGAYPGIPGDASSVFSPRRQQFLLTSSAPSLPIPTWAQGGKGVVYVTGSGGGGGSAGTNAGLGKGGAGAIAIRHMIIIPRSASTVQVVVGAGGVTPDIDSSGTSGGESSLSFLGQNYLTLGGGSGGTSVGGGGGAISINGQPFNLASYETSSSTIDRPYLSERLVLLMRSAAFFNSGLMGGISGSANAQASGGLWPSSSYMGGISPFGYGSVGFGAGSNQTNVSGRPGFMLLEFVEGF